MSTYVANKQIKVRRRGQTHFYMASDVDRKITFVSPSVRDVLGFSVSDLIGRRCRDFVIEGHHLNIAADAAYEARRQSAIADSYLRAALDRDGNERVINIQWYAQREPSGPLLGSHMCIRDVTELYLQHVELRDRLDALESVTRRLTPRESRTLSLAAAGNLNKKIANCLSVSVRTIEATRKSIIEKMELVHIQQAIAIEAERNTLKSIVSVLQADLGIAREK